MGRVGESFLNEFSSEFKQNPVGQADDLSHWAGRETISSPSPLQQMNEAASRNIEKF